MKPTYSILLIFYMLCSPPCFASISELEPDLPSRQIQLFTGLGSQASYNVNLNLVYKDIPLVGVLYLPKDYENKATILKTFYKNFMNRGIEFTKEEILADDCTCLVLTKNPDRELRMTIESLKVYTAFFLGSDDNALVNRHKINSNMPALMLFDKGKLIYKETLGKGDPIPLF